MASEIVSLATEIEVLCERVPYDRHTAKPDYVNEINKRLPRLRALLAEFELITESSLAEMAKALMEWSYQASMDLDAGNGEEAIATIKEAREHFQLMFRDYVENGQTAIPSWDTP